MRERTELGRLVVGGAEAPVRESRGLRKRRGSALRPVLVWGGLLVAATVIGMLWASGWLPSLFVPDKLVLRGCYLTQPEEVLLAMKCTGQESLLTLWLRSRKLAPSGARWLRGVKVDSVSARQVTLDVAESRPVLLASMDGADYWLCSDGRVLPVDAAADQGQLFNAIRALPHAEFASGKVAADSQLAGSILALAAACQAVMPGVIRLVSVGADRTIWLVDREAFRVYLGEPTNLAAKVGALPKALRICAADRDRLRYLDASNPRMLFQKWKEPPR